MLDLKSIVTLDTAKVEILHPVTEKATGIVVEVVSSDSETARKVDREHRNERLKRLSRGGRKSTALTADDLDDAGLDLLVKCTVGWEGLMENGKVLPFDQATARRVYTEVPWLREQVDAAIADRALFIRS